MTAPWKHQSVASEYIKTHNAWYLDDDMGCGKTRCVVDAVCDERYPRTLVICPKSVVPVWAAQFGLHRPDEAAVTPLKGTGPKKWTAMADALDRSGLPIVIVVNYESVWRKPLDAVILGTRWNLVVADEAHRAKAPGSRQSLFLSRINADRRGALSGTPFHHDPLDIYAQMRFVDPHVYGWSYVKFRSRYAEMGGHTVNGRAVQVIGYRNLDELNLKFRSRCVRPMQLKKRDVLDLPRVMHETIAVELDESRDVYDQLVENYEAEVAAGTITVANAMVRTLRLRQATGGFGGTDEKLTAVFGHEKRDALEEFLDDLSDDEPVIVFCNFDAEIAMVHAATKAAGRPSAEMTGSRKDFADTWKPASGEVLAVNIRSGGLGLNLTAGCYAVYFSQPVSLGDYDQSLARLDRPGQTRPVTYYHLIATNSVDGDVRGALAKRGDIIQRLTKGGLGHGGDNGSADIHTIGGRIPVAAGSEG